MCTVDSTVVVTNIRNFTGLYEEFERRDSLTFIKFMEKYNELHLVLAEEIAGDSFYVNTTGDGILCVFKGEMHEIYGYTFALCMYKTLSYMCKKFSKEYNVRLSFGIGADSGHVTKIYSKNKGFEVKTYLGSVINRATRIESSTKEYHYTNMAISGNLYKNLVKRIYNIQHKLFDDNTYEELLEKPEMIKISKDLLLYYIFEKLLKGVSEPTPIFRLAKIHADNNKQFTKTLIRLNGKDNTRKFTEIMRNYRDFLKYI